MPVHGPCRVAGCIDSTKSLGQWQRVPKEFCIEHSLDFGEDITTANPASGRSGSGAVPQIRLFWAI